MRSLRTAIPILALGAAIAAIGCGGGDDDAGGQPTAVEQDPGAVEILQENIRRRYRARGYSDRQADCIVDSLRPELRTVEIGNPLDPPPEIVEAVQASARACAEAG